MLKKPLLIATLGAAVALGGLATKAQAADPVLGALIGGGIGAAIGHDVNRHGGAAVGGGVGALVGSSIAASSNDYYYGEPRYYEPGYAYAPGYGYAPAPAPVYVAPAPRYYVAPAPVYYGPTVVYTSRGYRGGHRGHGRHWR